MWRQLSSTSRLLDSSHFGRSVRRRCLFYAIDRPRAPRQHILAALGERARCALFGRCTLLCMRMSNALCTALYGSPSTCTNAVSLVWPLICIHFYLLNTGSRDGLINSCAVSRGEFTYRVLFLLAIEQPQQSRRASRVRERDLFSTVIKIRRHTAHTAGHSPLRDPVGTARLGLP